ncbi:MAG: hypothetical protein ABEL76_03970 [Bradymonadaceae bacterium]
MPCCPLFALCFVGAGLLSSGCSTDDSGKSDDKLVGEPATESATLDGNHPPTSSDRSHALWYRFAMRDRGLAIRVRLLKPPAKTTFFLPASNRTEWRFQIVDARGPSGRIRVRRTGEGRRLDLRSDGLKWVELHYRVRRPTPRAPRTNAVLEIPSILVVPSRELVDTIRDIPVELHAPSDWRVVTTWRRRSQRRSTVEARRTVHGFVTDNLRDLRDAFVAAGPRLTVRQRGSGSDRVRVAFESGLDAPVARLTRFTEGVVDHYRTVFGDLGPVSAVVAAGPEGRRDLPRGSGRGGGFLLRLPPGAVLDRSTRLLVAHEALHVWNGHYLVPDPRSELEVRWFEEGVTHYLAVKALRRLGTFDGAGVRRMLARTAHRYLQNPVAGGGTADRRDRRRLPYDRGLLLGVAFDAALAQTSSRSLTVESWLRAMLDQPEAHRHRYDADDLERALSSLVGGQCGSPCQLWRRYVEQRRRLDLDAIFASLGYEFRPGETPGATRLTARPDGPVFPSVLPGVRPSSRDASYAPATRRGTP